MWLSSKMRPAPPTSDADLGITTIAGNSVGVMTRGEVRTLPVYGPGGYVWMPENGAAVLVVKGGPGGQEQCVAGMRQAEPPQNMQPGEVRISGPGGGAIYFKADGTVDIQGKLTINGTPYMPCTCGGVL